MTGWQKFMRRRQAVDKINSLPEARPEQLQEFDDVCAICYQEMGTARITRCNHYFHGVCLRKWLYVQDICPLCHDVLYVEAEVNQPADNNNEPAAGVVPEAGEVPPVAPEAPASDHVPREPDSSSSGESSSESSSVQSQQAASN